MCAAANADDLDKVYNSDLFFQLSPDLLCIAGYDGYFRRINPAVSKLLGFTEEELFARPIHEFIHPDDKGITAQHRKNLISDSPLLNFENRYVKKNGEIVWLSWTSVPLDSEKLVYAIAKNITHKKKLEYDRNHLIGNITRINDDLKQLSYTTTHDLRSPVNNLLSVFSFLDVSKIDDEETVELIGLLKITTEELKQTLNNYVDTLIKKESAYVEIEEVDIEACLDVVRQSVKSLIENSNTTIRFNFAAAPQIKFNRNYLESIFLNLITNSIKYARPDSFPDIDISTKVENGKNQLIFSDRGQGFDLEKVKDDVFGFQQQFHQNADSKGIGLYLVYNHVTRLGGTISIDSKVNEGSTFVITFKK